MSNKHLYLKLYMSMKQTTKTIKNNIETKIYDMICELIGYYFNIYCIILMMYDHLMIHLSLMNHLLIQEL